MPTCADDEDEYIGSLSLCSIDDDHGKNCDVTAVDKFHGLRVAHPIEAHRMGQGITVGRDASCGLVVDDPSVSGRQLAATHCNAYHLAQVPWIVFDIVIPLPDTLFIFQSHCNMGVWQETALQETVVLIG